MMTGVIPGPVSRCDKKGVFPFISFFGSEKSLLRSFQHVSHHVLLAKFNHVSTIKPVISLGNGITRTGSD